MNSRTATEQEDVVQHDCHECGGTVEAEVNGDFRDWICQDCGLVVGGGELVTDGGHLASDPGPEDYPDPEDDPFACSICGHYLHELQRVSGDDYCESCKREHDPTHVIHNCLGCGREALQEEMEAIDISPPDEYYPEIRYLCRDCDGDTEEDSR